VKFSEWYSHLQKVHDSVKDIALYDLFETMSVEGHTVSITVGKELHGEVDGNPSDPIQFRHMYTDSKMEFDQMLGAIEQNARDLSQAMTMAFAAVTDEVVPELVVARLTGENPSGDPKAVLNYMTAKKMLVLSKIWRKAAKLGGGMIPTHVKGLDMEMTFDSGMLECRVDDGKATLKWQGNKPWDALDNELIVDYPIEDNLTFLGAFDKIQQALLTTVNILKQLEHVKAMFGGV
jgi:hypothetical protein